MPNRILKESICTSENIDSLSAFQETVFYRLIVSCDDYGRMDARPKLLASRLFPLKDIRAAQIEDALRALTSAELVTLYEVDGKPFLQMKTWDRHQQVRAKKSKYPAPDSNLQSPDITCNQMISDDIECSRNPIQSVSESESNPNAETARAQGRFVPPTVEEVRAYCQEKGYDVDPELFVAHYETNGWKVGRTPMKNWKSACVTWSKNEFRQPQAKPSGSVIQAAYDQRKYVDRKPGEMPEWLADELAMQAAGG